MACILIVTKNDSLKKQLSDAMSELLYSVVGADGLSSAFLAISEDKEIDLVIGDIASEGCELCRELRDFGNNVPFITVIDENVGIQRRQVFRSGSDGYLILPLDPEEVQMHVKNLLWRCHIESDSVIRFGDVTLHSATLSVETPDITIRLRRMEFLLLQKLLSYPGRIFNRSQLMDDLWGFDCESDPRTVDTHIRRLRKKLKSIDTINIQTIRGIGYRAAVPKRRRLRSSAEYTDC